MASRRAKNSRSRASRPARSSRNGRRGRRGAVPPELRRLILRKVASGHTAVDVAREHGVHATTISVWKAQDRTQQAPPGDPSTLDPSPASRLDTGRYSKAFKHEVLRQVASKRSALEVAAQYGIPAKTVYRWQKAAEDAGGELPDPHSSRPPASGPSPIDEQHRELVLSLKQKHPNMGPAQIQKQLRRFHAVKISRHMIGRIFAEAGIPLEKRSAGDHDSDPANNRFEMTRPNELWAVDFKEFWIHSEKAFALFVLDDFSRFVVGFALTQKPSAELAIETVNKAIQRYGRPERILSDRGPQFHAWNGVSRFDRFLGDFLVDHTVTKAGHCFTNGKVEAFNCSLQRELLDVEELSSLKEAEAAIADFVTRHNFQRAHMGIGGLTPADRYLGMVEEARRALEEGLKNAGPRLAWLSGLVSEDGAATRPPAVLQLVVRDGKLELVVLGRRFTLG